MLTSAIPISNDKKFSFLAFLELSGVNLQILLPRERLNTIAGGTAPQDSVWAENSDLEYLEEYRQQ